MPIEIRRLVVPERLGTPEAAGFEAYATLGFELERANWGHDHFAETATELLGRHRNDLHRGHAVFGAWDGATMVGRCGLDWERDERAATVELTLGVLPSERRRGIGSLLLAAAEDAARELGRATVVAYSDHPDTTGVAAAPQTDAAGGGAVLRAPDGDAELSAATPAAGFAAAHGYALGQLERVSSITVDGRTEEFRRLLAARTARAAAEGYRLELWTDRTPERLVDAYAAARARMVLDVPAGGVTLDEERWDAARVREHESEELDGGTGVLVAVAVTDDGEVAGYTELELPPDRAFAYQYDTLVVGAHRGHGLGMLVKLANLVRLAEAAPERTVVYTWNADENEHMLAINVALGFRRCGLEAIWQRELDETTPQADAG
jgi:L-amino acid N-acyltransferase YncA